LQNDIDRLLSGEDRRSLDDVMAEMRLLGPPTSVRMRLLRGGEQLAQQELPPEALDGEVSSSCLRGC